MRRQQGPISPKRVVLVRGSELRHKALDTSLRSRGHEVLSIVEAEDLTSIAQGEEGHFSDRRTVEDDFFGLSVQSAVFGGESLIRISDLNAPSTVRKAMDFEPEYVITFGCSLLREPWLKDFDGKLLGVHLGLSPYYRGAACNFWSIHNGDFGAVGFTLMQLSAGVDTGAVVHQQRARFVRGDSLHTIGNRVILDMIRVVDHLVDNSVGTDAAMPLPTLEGLYYRASDFNPQAIKQATEVLLSTEFLNFLEDPELECNRFPLVHEI